MFNLGRSFASKRLKSVFELSQEIKIISRSFSCKVTFQCKIPPEYLLVRNNQTSLGFTTGKLFHKSAVIRAVKKDSSDEKDEENALRFYSEFDKCQEKNKEAFLETVRQYLKHAKRRANHVDFMKAALKKMKEHGVHKDLECYKKILNVLPKGVYVSKNRWMAGAMYFPRQQYAVIDLIIQMGTYGVWPDAEMGVIIVNIFGKNSIVYKKFLEYMYWSVKWRNRSPFILPEKLPRDPLILAKLAIERITSVDPQTEISVLDTNTVKESIDKTWIVSGQSPKQIELLKKHSHNVPVIVEGGNLVWLRDKSINYFALKADGGPHPFIHPEDASDISNLQSKFFNPNYKEIKKEDPSVHEQDDGIVFAVCATGTSSKDSLLSWIRLLQTMGNSVLADVPVLFRFHEKEKLPSPFTDALAQQDS